MSSPSTFEGHNEGPMILAVCWALLIIPGLVLAMRIWCKGVVSRGLGWDDMVISIAWVFIYLSICNGKSSNVCNRLYNLFTRP